MRIALISSVIGAGAVLIGIVVGVDVADRQIEHDNVLHRADIRRESYAQFHSAATELILQGVTAAASPDDVPFGFTTEERAALRPFVTTLFKRRFEVDLVASRAVKKAVNAVMDVLPSLATIDTTDPEKAARDVVDVDAKVIDGLARYEIAVREDLGLD